MSLSGLRLNASCGNQVQSHHILLLMFPQVNCNRYFHIQVIYAIVVWNFMNMCLLVFYLKMIQICLLKLFVTFVEFPHVPKLFEDRTCMLVTVVTVLNVCFVLWIFAAEIF